MILHGFKVQGSCFLLASQPCSPGHTYINRAFFNHPTCAHLAEGKSWGGVSWDYWDCSDCLWLDHMPEPKGCHTPIDKVWVASPPPGTEERGKIGLFNWPLWVELWWISQKTIKCCLQKEKEQKENEQQACISTPDIFLRWAIDHGVKWSRWQWFTEKCHTCSNCPSQADNNLWNLTRPQSQPSTCMVRPLKRAVLMLSVHPLPDQCLVDLNPINMLAPGPSWWLFSSKGSFGAWPPLVSWGTNEPTYNWLS